MESAQVAKAVLIKLGNALGHRLQHFKANGGLAADGSVTFQTAAYTLTYGADNFLASVTHNVTNAVHNCPANYPFVKGQVALTNNIFDEHATIETEGWPPVTLMSLFKRNIAAGGNLGPWTVTDRITKTKEFKEFAGTAKHEILDQKNVLTGDVTALTKQANEEVQVHHDIVSQEKSRKGRTAAAIRLQQTKARKTINM